MLRTDESGAALLVLSNSERAPKRRMNRDASFIRNLGLCHDPSVRPSVYNWFARLQF